VETPVEEPAVDPGWLVPWTSVDGYTYDLEITPSVAPLASDITTAPPGFAAVSLPIGGHLRVTNTTPTRNAPASPGVLLLAVIYPAASPLCDLSIAWALGVKGADGYLVRDTYCGIYSQNRNDSGLSRESDLTAGESRDYDLSGVVTGQLPESDIAQATTDAAAPIWAGAIHIGQTPEDLYRCAANFNHTVFWSSEAIAGCTDVAVGTAG
jgi:hypothetical protein